MNYDDDKLTADKLRNEVAGRWLEVFTFLRPGFFNDAIEKLGRHVLCPFCGREEKFRFIKRSSQHRGTTNECGFSICTCGKRDGFRNLHESGNNSRFYDTLKELDEYLHPLGRKKGASARAAAPVRRIGPSPEEMAELNRQINEKLQKLWGTGKTWTPATVPYYVERGIDPRVLAEVRDVRFVSSLSYWDPPKTKGGGPVKVGSFPAYLAAMRNPEGEIVALHRTWLSPDRKGKAQLGENRKAKKLSETSGASGAAIRLFDPGNCDVLGLCEGIETGLAARQLCEGGYWPELGKIPVWPCYAEGNLRSFVIPPELVGQLRKIVVFVDNDGPGPIGIGLAAALVFKQRMAEEHPDIEVDIKLPPIVEWDWNDVLMYL